MGCDIHLHSEVKIYGVWRHYDCPRIPRNYRLFSLMAGVRGDLKPVRPPQGIPSDATFLTKFDYFEVWGGDAHTPTYLAWDDLISLAKSMEQNREMSEFCDYFGFLFGNDWTDRENKPEGVEDVRFVFWFDN